MEYSEEDRQLFSLAQECSRNEDTQGVADSLQKLVALRPNSAAFASMLASSLKCLGNIADAERHFRSAVSLAPESETYSLALFHSLWEQGRQLEALEEMKRFMSLSDSQEYREILADLPKSDE